MDERILVFYQNIFLRENIDSVKMLSAYNQIYSEDQADSFNDMIDRLIMQFNDNIELLINTASFINNYRIFLFNIIKNEMNTDNYYDIMHLINANYDCIKIRLKKYNKGELKKDCLYSQYKLMQKVLSDSLFTVRDALKYCVENHQYRIIWFIINNLHETDYVFRLIEVNPDIVNIKSNNNHSLFYNLIEKYVSEIDHLDITYYKRIFMMLLESDKLRISNKELSEIVECLENNAHNKKYSADITFVLDELCNHYLLLESNFRENVLSRLCANDKYQILYPKLGRRNDLTQLYTFSIDDFSNRRRILFDDAYSIEVKKDHSVRLYLHIPDVDEFIKRDSETDQILRMQGVSVYKNPVKPLIPFNEAKKMSLAEDQTIPAITFIIELDDNYNIISYDVCKSLVRVNHNFKAGYVNYILKEVNQTLAEENLVIAADIARKLRRSRNELIGNISESQLIMEEFNILPNMLMADFFHRNNLVFAYKNFLGKRSCFNIEHQNECAEFAIQNELNEAEKSLLYSVFDINHRIIYDTNPLPNASFNGRIIGSVSNPLREYMSLESIREIKDLMVYSYKMYSYWQERIPIDCIEQTEIVAKIRSLYNNN